LPLCDAGPEYWQPFLRTGPALESDPGGKWRESYFSSSQILTRVNRNELLHILSERLCPSRAMLVFKSLFIVIALLVSSPAASASLFRKKSQQQSPSSTVLDFAAKSDVVVNAHIYRKDSSGLYQAKVKLVYKGCKVAQYDSILVDVGSGDSYNGCGPADLKGNYRYLLFGQITHRNSKTGRSCEVVWACRTSEYTKDSFCAVPVRHWSHHPLVLSLAWCSPSSNDLRSGHEIRPLEQLGP
jgi:hypothetical protein